jgi:hypothetical protein
VDTNDREWWDALKRLKGNWWYSPGEGLVHILRNHVADTHNGRCTYCKAKAPPGVKMISLLQEGFRK